MALGARFEEQDIKLSKVDRAFAEINSGLARLAATKADGLDVEEMRGQASPVLARSE